MIPLYIPYITLGLLIISLFFIRSRKIINILIVMQIAIAFLVEIILPIGLVALLGFWILCDYHWNWNKPGKNRWASGFFSILIIVFALGFANHLIPGFQNIKILDSIQFSPISSPYSMYLNMDKTMMAVILVATNCMLLKQERSFNIKSIFICLILALLCSLILMSIAILQGFIEFDPKISSHSLVWVLNNLLFVCFAEEALFRGFVQNDLMKMTHRIKINPFMPILFASLLFATTLLGHLKGGLSYILFVTIAGVFYGYAYYKVERLEAAIAVHFLVNAMHFFLFTYPKAMA